MQYAGSIRLVDKTFQIKLELLLNMLNCCHTECRDGESHYAECHYAECHFVDCHHAECYNAECYNAEKCFTQADSRRLRVGSWLGLWPYKKH